MPFGPTGAPASFQSYINWVLGLYLDITVIFYLDNVFVFLRNSSQHEKHVQEVLKSFLKAGLFAKVSKCLFNVTRIPFFSFILTNKRVEMKEDYIHTILNWPEPESLFEVQCFL